MKIKKILKNVLLISVLWLPITVNATDDSTFSGVTAIIIELFCSIHMSIFVLFPLAKLLSKDKDNKQLFLKFFLIRAIFLLIGDIINPIATVIIDIVFLFLGAFILQTFTIRGKISELISRTTVSTSNTISKPIEIKAIKCSKCGHKCTIGNNKYCPKCGNHLLGSNIINNASEGIAFNKAEYDESLFYDSSIALEKYIENYLNTSEVNKNISIPIVEKKKNNITYICAIVISILLILFFAYHASIFLLVALIMALIFYLIQKQYDIKKYLTKEIKNRPSEKIDYIISSTLSAKIDNTKNRKLRVSVLVLVFIIQLTMFYKPHLIYERSNEGYSIRYYTIGILKKDKELIIPKEHKGKPVIGIRGKVFVRNNSLEKVILPETIKEIRGEAFLKCTKLKTINLPKGITEIKGSTFEGCTNLESIEIPEGVTRIGGSAFRDCKNLSKATIPKTVMEIGSSAFRNTKVGNVCISHSAYVNERAFKGAYAYIYYYENGCMNGSENDYGY